MTSYSHDFSNWNYASFPRSGVGMQIEFSVEAVMPRSHAPAWECKCSMDAVMDHPMILQRHQGEQRTHLNRLTRASAASGGISNQEHPAAANHLLPTPPRQPPPSPNAAHLPPLHSGGGPGWGATNVVYQNTIWELFRYLSTPSKRIYAKQQQI